ncbi:MAG: HIT family protein [Thermoplasmatota archaeon]
MTIFDAILAGDIPCHKVYEDDRVLAFLDIAPLTDGHTLVIPKKGAPKLDQLDPADAAAVMAAIQKILPGLRDATGCPDATVALHDGPAAGQEVPHVHFHLIPRKPGDAGGPVHALFSSRASEANLASLAAKIQESL